MKKNHEPQAEQVFSENIDSEGSESESPAVAKPLSVESGLKKSGSKRKPASDAKASKISKKEKGVGVGADDEGKKSALFQRLWSDDDEIVVLKGILEYEREKGSDPMVDTVGLHEFIKDSLHANFDRRQMVDKIRRLKKRYANSVFNKKKNFTAHELTTFGLSSKIWGSGKDDDVADQQTESNMKTRTVSKAEASKGLNGDAVTYRGNADSTFQFIGKTSISMGLDENIVKMGLEMCRQDQKAEIEEKWKQFYREESDLFFRKLDLARQESKMIAEALKSGGK